MMHFDTYHFLLEFFLHCEMRNICLLLGRRQDAHLPREVRLHHWVLGRRVAPRLATKRLLLAPLRTLLFLRVVNRGRSEIGVDT